MREIVEFFQEKGIVFKSFKEIPPKALGSRKKVAIHVTVDLKGYYADVM